MKLTTAKKVEGIQLPKGKRDYIQFDDDIPGLGLRIREGGSRTWIFQYRIGSKQRRMVLGSAKSAQLNLAEIRKTASRLHGRVELGQDPAMDKETARIEAGNTVGALLHQIAALRWDEVHDEQIVLSGERTKNGRTHVVPLSEAAKSILANFPRGNRKHLFGGTIPDSRDAAPPS
jgi:hypothetical protein